MNELAEQILSHAKAIWRFRWYAVVSAWVIALAGWMGVYKMPERYEATARLYADTQSVLRPLLTGVAVQPNLDQMVAMMSQTLVSGPNLERVIEMAGLEAGLRSDVDRTKLITRLRTAITIKSAGKENLYAISCIDKDPRLAEGVVQSLLTLFVEGSLTGNRDDSDSARNFIDEQLKGYREKLVAAESSITAFKRRYLGLMPGEGPGYFAQLNEAKAILGRATLDLQEAENARDSIRQRLASEAENSILQGDKIAVAGVVIPESDLDRRIASLEQKLDNLRVSYTDEHPDIVALVPAIAQLKEQRMAEEAELKRQEAKLAQSGSTAPTTIQMKNPVYQQLSVSLSAAESTVAVMKTRVAEYNRRYAELQASAIAMPQVEAEYAQLTRDYEVNKARYAELLKRRDSAQISGDMGETDAAMTFRVVDPPRVVSTRPDSRLLMTIVLIAALLGGVGIAFFMSQIKPTINDERKLREVSGLLVLGTIMQTMSSAQKARQRGGLAALLLSVVSLLSAYVAIMAGLVLISSRV